MNTFTLSDQYCERSITYDCATVDLTSAYPFTELPSSCAAIQKQCAAIYKEWPEYLRDQILEFLRGAGPIIASTQNLVNQRYCLQPREGGFVMSEFMHCVHAIAVPAEREDIRMLTILSSPLGMLMNYDHTTMHISNEMCTHAVELYYEYPEFYNIASVAEYAMSGRTLREVLELFPPIRTMPSERFYQLKRTAFIEAIERCDSDDMALILEHFSITGGDRYTSLESGTFITVAIENMASKEILLLLASSTSLEIKMKKAYPHYMTISEFYAYQMRERGGECDPDVLLALSEPHTKNIIM